MQERGTAVRWGGAGRTGLFPRRRRARSLALSPSEAEKTKDPLWGRETRSCAACSVWWCHASDTHSYRCEISLFVEKRNSRTRMHSVSPSGGSSLRWGIARVLCCSWVVCQSGPARGLRRCCSQGIHGSTTGEFPKRSPISPSCHRFFPPMSIPSRVPRARPYSSSVYEAVVFFKCHHQSACRGHVGRAKGASDASDRPAGLPHAIHPYIHTNAAIVKCLGGFALRRADIIGIRILKDNGQYTIRFKMPTHWKDQVLIQNWILWSFNHVWISSFPMKVFLRGEWFVLVCFCAWLHFLFENWITF
jgi:hypothetical protein